VDGQLRGSDSAVGFLLLAQWTMDEQLRGFLIPQWDFYFLLSWQWMGSGEVLWFSSVILWNPFCKVPGYLDM